MLPQRVPLFTDMPKYYVHYALHVESWVDSMFPLACHVCLRLLWGFNGNMPVKDHLTSARTSDGTSSPTLGLFTFSRNYRNSMGGWQHAKGTQT